MDTTDKRPAMRLSEAIRLGATMGPQYFGGLFSSEPGSACAMGAAYLAMGWRTDLPVERQECDHWLWTLSRRVVLCPDCDHVVLDVVSIITHLNDRHRRTREQIADWVELEEVRLGLYPVDEISEPVANEADLAEVQQQRTGR